MKKHLSRLLTAVLCTAMLTLPAAALTVDDALELLDQVYLREIPQAAYQAKDLDELFRLLGDPYTYYMSAGDYQSFLDSVEHTTDVVGIGVSIQYTDQGIFVVSVLSGSSAQEAGLKDGDLIVAIDGVSCVPARETHRDLVVGEEGSEVTVTILRDGVTRDYRMIRRPVVVPNTQVEVLDGGIGYIDCDSFGSQTGTYFVDGMTEYDGEVAFWMVDLRGNPGGYTSAAGEVTNVFIGPCYYLYMENRPGMIYGYHCDEEQLSDKPLLLLLDGSSASASEAVAANLRDLERCVSLGERTYGKGVAQVVLDKEQYGDYFDGDGMKVTAYRFYSNGGNTTDQIGVIPTLMVDRVSAQAVAEALCGTEADARFAFQINGQMCYVRPDAEPSVLTNLFAALPPTAPVYWNDNGTWSASSIEQIADRLNVTYASRWFTDTADSPYANQINALATYRLVLGTGEGKFSPKSTLTRAQLCALLAQTLGVSYTGASHFTDVSPSAWYFEEVNAIAQLGLVNGVGGGRFNPNALLTQEELLTILGRMARYLNFALDGYGAQLELGLEQPKDADALASFASWAQNGAAVLAWGTQETINGWKPTLYAPLNDISPKAPVLREEAAAGLYTLLAGLCILP